MDISSLKTIVEETPPEDIQRLAVENYFPKQPERYTFKGLFYLFVYKLLIRRKGKKIRKEINGSGKR